MANRANNSRPHSAPGLYFNETVMTYADKSLGITKLGLAGETLSGPAFQPVSIKNWREFQTFFGGTSTKKFRGSQYPKYELPYIAKTYLEESDQLEVVRVLGLSGVNAGPAWVITATKQKIFNGWTYVEEYDNNHENDYKNVDNVDHNPITVLPTNDTIKNQTPNDYPGDGFYPEYLKLPYNHWDQYCINCDESDEASYSGRIYSQGINDNRTPYQVVTEEFQNPTANSVYMVKKTITEESEAGAGDGVYQRTCFIWKTDYKYYHLVYKNGIQLTEEDFCDTCSFDYNNMVVAVLRSRGEHKKYSFVRTPTEDDIAQGRCDDIYEYDGIEYKAKCVNLVPSASLELGSSCNPGFNSTTGDFTIDSYNRGTFTIVVNGEKNANTGEIEDKTDGTTRRYSVSLNPSEKNYIYNVLGGNPEDGDAYVYVEELYDVALEQLINEGRLNSINSEVVKYPAIKMAPKYEDVYDLLTEPTPSKYDIGRRYLCSEQDSIDKGIMVRYSDDGGLTWFETFEKIPGMIYTVMSKLNPDTGKNEIFYGAYIGSEPDMFAYEKVNWDTENDPTGLDTDYCADTDPDVCIALTGTRFNDDTCSISYNSFYDCTLFGIVKDNPTLSSPLFLRLKSDEACTGNENGYYKKIFKKDGNGDYIFGNSTEKGRPTERLEKVELTTTCSDGSQGCYCDDDYSYEECVYVSTYDSFFKMGDSDVEEITLDFNNYKEAYRYSSTPWIVSEVKGSAENIELNRLFRFHTISDGNDSSRMFKVSIENIDPSTGMFDVIVRDFNDSDTNIIALERFGNCTLVPGDKNYIALKIGSFDETYNQVSKYITVEVNENDNTKTSVPAGFLGYPLRNYSGTALTTISKGSLSTNPKQPYFKFNNTIDSEIRPKRQYFGVSNLVGIDTDVLSYKGVEAYKEDPKGLTPCFHLDARIFNGTPDSEGKIHYGDMEQVVSVDGEIGYSWVTVSKNETTSDGIEPRIGSESTMNGTIYEDKRYRKFTVAFYGGWDGWDYYRTYRSNTDEFKYSNYKGAINNTSGYGSMFSAIKDPEMFDLDGIVNPITSDYYAYLAGIRAFANPKSIDINVLATPGIDYVNNNLLVDDVIEMVEEERADCVYVVTTPDKPFGAGDSKSEMYGADEAVMNLENSDIDSNHTATYYPWVKYFDNDNNEYVYLPITRDVVKSIALTDNQAWPWFAAAGYNRGVISGVGPRKKLKLAEQDALYDGRLNYVASFSNEGNRIWGDKNTQIADNQLNRLSARRLLLRIRTMLKEACIGLIFDPNDSNCSKAVRSATAAVLDNVRENRGISDYRIEIDDSPTMRDQMGLGVTYWIRRNSMLEWISFTSILSPHGMQW